MIFVFVGFGLAFLGIAVWVARHSPVDDIDDFIVAGRRLPFGVVSASVMVSWLWTTSLLGAAEAGYLFGIGGGFAFAFGSAVPFFVFIPLALRLRRIMPHGTTFLEFLQQRYGTATHHLILGMTIVMALYICVEQIIGVAYAVSGSFDVSYPLVAIGATAVVVGYIAIAGLRGAVINDVIQFVIISAVSLILIPIILSRFGIGALYDGLQRAAANSDVATHNADAMTFWAPAAVRYFAVAMVVSMGFVLLNQGYYSKARAAGSSKSLMGAYIVGTVVAWLPIPILFGMVLGGIGVADELTVGDELRVTTDVSAYIFGENFGSVGSLLFSMTIFMAGLTTAGNSLAGFQAAMAVDVQEGVMRSDRTSRQRKRFTQIATLVFGLVTCIGALALEGVSLLRVDIVSGIVFASPIGALLIGMFWRRPSAPLAIGSVLVGVCSGLVAYIVIDDPDIDYFIGNLVSLLVPVAILLLSPVVSRQQYDFCELERYGAGDAGVIDSGVGSAEGGHSS